jgi:hypothetical protein
MVNNALGLIDEGNEFLCLARIFLVFLAELGVQNFLFHFDPLK